MAGGYENRENTEPNLTPGETLWVQSGTAGILLLLEQLASPSATPGYGKVYVKEDKKLYYMNEDGTEIELGGSSGTTLSTEVPTGAVDDSNVEFEFLAKPFQIFINHGGFRENSGWTWDSMSLTATLDFPVGTGGDIYGLIQT